MKDKNKLLYVATHGLGDIMMALPAIRLLIENEFDLTVLVKSPLEESFLLDIEKSSIKSIIVLSDFKKNGNFLGFLKLTSKLRSEKFSIAVSQLGVNKKVFKILCIFSNISHYLYEEGYPNSSHKVERSLKLISPLLDKNIILSKTKLNTFSPSNKEDRVTEKIIVIAPGGGIIETHKRWPAQYFKILVASLSEKYPEYKFVITGGPDEEDLCNSILDANNKSITSITNASILDTFLLLKKAEIAITNCNGLSHLAAYAGAQVIGIYGPTNAYTTGPYTEKLSVVSKELECSPCYRRGYITGCGNPICLKELPYELVEKRVVDILNK